MTKAPSSPGMRTALIGLIGTLLTVCGGVTGALLTNAAAIYSLEMENRKVDAAASDGARAITVDTGGVFITRQAAADLDPAEYYVDLEQSFVMLRPLPGWEPMESLSVGEQLAESGAQCSQLCSAPVYRIRHGDPLLVGSDRATTVNGKPIPDRILDTYAFLYGPPPWQAPNYDQLILNIFPKADLPENGFQTLPDLVLYMTGFSPARVERLVSPQDSHFALVQSTSRYGNITIAGQSASLTVDSWMYFVDAQEAYYVIEISYMNAGGSSIQAWDELQNYIDHFRVVQE